MTKSQITMTLVLTLLLSSQAFAFGNGKNSQGQSLCGLQIKANQKNNPNPNCKATNGSGIGTADLPSSSSSSLQSFVTSNEVCANQLQEALPQIRKLKKTDPKAWRAYLDIVTSKESRQARNEARSKLFDLYLSDLKSGVNSSEASKLFSRGLSVAGSCHGLDEKLAFAGNSSGGSLDTWIAEREACIDKNNELKAEFKVVYDNFQTACQSSNSGVCQNYTSHYMSYTNIDNKTLPENYSVHYGRAYREDKIYLTDLLKDKAIDNEQFNQGIAVAGACDERIARDISFASSHWQSNIGIANLPSNNSPRGGGGSFASQATTPTSVVPTFFNSRPNATTSSNKKANARVPASSTTNTTQINVGGAPPRSYHGTDFHAH